MAVLAERALTRLRQLVLNRRNRVSERIPIAGRVNESAVLRIGRRELAELRAKGKGTTEDYQCVRELTRAIEQLERASRG